MITKNKSSLFLAALLAVTFTAAGTANAGKPSVAGPCVKCHTAEADTVRGNLGTVSPDFNTLQVKVGKKLIWIVNYDDKTSVVNGDKTSGAESIKDLPKKKEISVSYSGGESNPLATEFPTSSNSSDNAASNPISRNEGELKSSKTPRICSSEWRIICDASSSTTSASDPAMTSPTSASLRRATASDCTAPSCSSVAMRCRSRSSVTVSSEANARNRCW